MSYATVGKVEAGFRALTSDEQAICSELLLEADVIIDNFNANATSDNKELVECRMVRRAIGSTDTAQSFPLGASQGSVSANGYSQSWTITNGSTGELYLAKADKDLLRKAKVGSYSPVEELV